MLPQPFATTIRQLGQPIHLDFGEGHLETPAFNLLFDFPNDSQRDLKPPCIIRDRTVSSRSPTSARRYDTSGSGAEQGYVHPLASEA